LQQITEQNNKITELQIENEKLKKSANDIKMEQVHKIGTLHRKFEKFRQIIFSYSKIEYSQSHVYEIKDFQ